MHAKACTLSFIETVEKVACQLIKIDKPLFREELHERQSSISREKVGLSFVGGVLSDVHAAGKDRFGFVPPPAGGGGAEIFGDLSPGDMSPGPFCCKITIKMQSKLRRSFVRFVDLEKFP